MRAPSRASLGMRTRGRAAFLFNTMMSQEILMNTYLCIVCGFVYDESSGRPEEGIPAGTHWDAVPADWACPECGVAKSDFEMVVI
jgi:rubredoxin